MARKNKLLQKSANTILMIIGVIALVGIGALFVNGTFLNVVLLKFLPQIIHTAVGYVIIVGSIFSGIVSLAK